MNDIMIRIQESMPAPAPEAAPVPQKIPLEDRVRDMVDCIESGEDSSVVWITLNKLYSALQDRKDPRSRNLCKMIEPTLAKYGQHKVAAR